MAANRLHSVSRFLRCAVYDLNRRRFTYSCVLRANFSTAEHPQSRRIWQGNLGWLVGSVGAGAVFGAGYAWYGQVKPGEMEMPQTNEAIQIEHTILPTLPDAPVSRRVSDILRIY